MKFTRTLALAVALALLVAPGFAREGKAPHAGSLGLWQTRLFGEANIEGVKFNLKGNGNFGRENSLHAGFAWSTGKLSDVGIGYAKVDHAGTIDKSVRIGGLTYVAGANVNLEVGALDLLGRRELTRGDRGFVDLVYGLKFVSVDVAATGRDNLGNALASARSFSAPFPQLGLAGEHAFDARWTVYGACYGFTVNRSGKGGTAKTMDVGVRRRLAPPVANGVPRRVDWSAEFGWKAQYLRAKDGADEVILDHEGPRLTLVGKF